MRNKSTILRGESGTGAILERKPAIADCSPPIYAPHELVHGIYPNLAGWTTGNTDNK